MLDFKTPVKEDLALLRKMCESYGTMGCDFNASNIFIWRKKYNIKICFYDGFLLLAYFRDGAPRGYCFPLGGGDPEGALAEIYRDGTNQRGLFVFAFVCRHQAGHPVVKQGTENHQQHIDRFTVSIEHETGCN